MKINERTKKCVAYLQYRLADGTYRYAGTCFFVTKDSKYKFVVTAKHVIEGIKWLGINEVYIRLNFKDGSTRSISHNINSWIYHVDNSVDIAVSPCYFPEEADHLYYLVSNFSSAQTLKDYDIGCWEEVFITGLFSHHSGNKNNMPIVRIGNIAMMPDEKIDTQMGLMTAYLIESRSIWWLSGSPVFLNLGSVRLIDGQIKQASDTYIPPLLGLIHGHFDSKSNDIDSIADDNSEAKKINVGIAIVTPIEKLIEVLELDKIKLHEKEIDVHIETLSPRSESD